MNQYCVYWPHLEFYCLKSPNRPNFKKIVVQQLGLTKLNILCKIEPNFLSKESRYLKIPRTKLIFQGFRHHFKFYLLTFCSEGISRDHQAKFSLFGVFDPNQVSKFSAQKMVTDIKKFSSQKFLNYQRKLINLNILLVKQYYHLINPNQENKLNLLTHDLKKHLKNK